MCCAGEMKSWVVFPNRMCHLHKNFVALALPLGIPAGTGLSAVARPRTVSGMSQLVRLQHPVLPVQSEAPKSLVPWETSVWKQMILISPGQSRTSHLLMFAICLFPCMLSHSLLEAV